MIWVLVDTLPLHWLYLYSDLKSDDCKRPDKMPVSTWQLNSSHVPPRIGGLEFVKKCLECVFYRVEDVVSQKMTSRNHIPSSSPHGFARIRPMNSQEVDFQAMEQK